MKFFTTPSSKNIIATLRIVTIEISELTFLFILYFHGQTKLSNCFRFKDPIPKDLTLKLFINFSVVSAMSPIMVRVSDT